MKHYVLRFFHFLLYSGELIVAYLNLIRHSYQDIIPGLINLKYPDASIELPANFLDIAKTSRFLYGDRLRWLSPQSDTDWDIVIFNTPTPIFKSGGLLQQRSCAITVS
ncbi:MAG: hypothetical protein V7K96_17895 [Nostoc sp.]